MARNFELDLCNLSLDYWMLGGSMINLTIQCDSMESNLKSEIKLYDIKNSDDVARELADQIDPGLLVTDNNQIQFLDAMDLKFIKQYVRDRES
jgi:hypothetical protein